MKTIFPAGNAAFSKLIFTIISALSTICVSAQTTIVNYNFDVANITNYQKFWPRAVNGIACTMTSGSSYDQNLHAGTGSFAGTVTGGSAFYGNTTGSPNRIAALKGSGAKYFDFEISGTSLPAYNTFKVYFQARKNSTGTTTINSIQYSVDGGAYTDIATSLSTTNSWQEFLYSLPSVSPLSTLNIRINFTSSASGTVFAIDNFQVQGNGPTSATVAIGSDHPIANNVYPSTTDNMIGAFKMDAHVSTITPTSVSVKTAGTYLITDVVNFKLWQNSVNSLYGATQIGSTVLTALSGTTLTFSGGYTSIPAGTSSYFFVTADILVTATAGRTVSINTNALSNFSFSGSPAKVGENPVASGSAFTVVANGNRYTTSSGSNNWDNGASVTRWSTTSGGALTGKWSNGASAYLETSGETIQLDNTTGAVASQINVSASNYNVQSTLTQVTTGLRLTSPSVVNVSGSNTFRLSNSSGGNGEAGPLLTTYGIRKEGSGELMFSQPMSIYSGGVQGPIFINGGTLTIGDKSNTNNPNLFIYDNEFYINNGKMTIAASSSTYASPGFVRGIIVDGTGSNAPAMELYNTGSSGSLYSEMTSDDRYPQLAIDLVPLKIKGTLTLNYGGNVTGVNSGIVYGDVTLNGDAAIKLSTSGSCNLTTSSGKMINAELAGEGDRTTTYWSGGGGSIGSFGITDNAHSFTFLGNGSSTSDGGTVAVNGSAGTSTGSWYVGKSDGSDAAYLAFNDVEGMTSGSITVYNNSQMLLNASGATVNIVKAPTITLNGLKTYSYYGALKLYNSTSGTTSSKLSSPIVVNTTDATVGIYNNQWTLAGAISGSGTFQLYSSNSGYNLNITSASNSWTGGTNVLSGIMNVSSGSSISTGPLAMAQLSGFSTALNLNNSAQTVSALSSSWTNTTGTQTQVITLATNHILTVNQSTNTTFGDGAVSTLKAYIAGAGNLIKDGTGTLELTGLNTYTGLTQVKGGTLKINNSYTGSCLPATNNVHIIGGTFEVAKDLTLNDVILSTGTLQVDNGVTLTINGTFTLVNGSINLVGTGKIAYGSTGTVTYAGSASQTTSTKEIPSSNGPKGITVDNNTNNGVTLNANVSGLTQSSVVYGWLDFNGKTLTGTGTFTLNGLVGPYAFTAKTTSGSATLTSVSSTASLRPGMKITGGSIPANTYIIYIDPLVANTVTMSANAGSTATGVSVSATGRGGLKVSMPGGIGDGTVNSHVQLTGTKTYNSGASYIFNTPTSGSSIYPAFPTTGTLNYSPAYDVTIQSGASNKVILGNSHDLEIANNLTLTTGLFVTNNNLITWDNSGGTLSSPNTPFSAFSTAANNSYIVTATNNGGALTPTTPYDGSKGFKIKNVGSGTDVYFPVGVDFSSANRMMINNTGTTTDLTVLLGVGDLAQTPGSRVNRIWYVKASAAAGVKANMKLFFTKRDWTTWPSPESEVESGFLYDNIMLIQKNYSQSFINKGSGTDITGANFAGAIYNNTEIYGQYTVGISADYSGAKNGINAFSRFSLVNPLIILPVTITNVAAQKQGSQIQVSWKSFNESNMDHYEVEKSSNGNTFKAIGNVNALNNGAAYNTYTLNDAEVLKGDNFYRIKAIGKDGSSYYTSIVDVNSADGKISVNVVPNPVQNRKMNLFLNNVDAGTYNLAVYNNAGQMVYGSVITHNGGSATQQIQLPASVRPGGYVLKLYGAQNQYTLKLMVE